MWMTLHLWLLIVLVPAAINQVFNVVDDTPYTILQLAEEIAEAFKSP